MQRIASPRPGYHLSSRSGTLSNSTPLSPRLGGSEESSADAEDDEFVSNDPFVGVDADEAMAKAERDLKADAEWKRIQQNTFTRWANEHLKQANKQINDLETELSDGLKLITLIEVLSGKRMPKHNRKPTFRSQKLENVSIALEFLEREGVTLVNIDSTDIVDCKLKLILGLIWTLILHYAISMPTWDGPPLGGVGEEKTPKQRLLGWVKDKLPDLPVNNFTTDWNSGKAVGALVDSVAPGLCPDWEDWDPRKPLQNAREAMDLADEWLNVPKILTPEEIVNPKLDEQSMMTYLSQFPNAKLKPGAPLRQRTNPSKVRAYGPGLEPKGLVAKAPAKFTVETFGAGDGEVTVEVVGPDGGLVDCDIVFNNDRKQTHSCSYFPEKEGDYVVNIMFASRPIPKSPFHVNVEGFAGDADKVTASGPGLEPEGVIINKPTYFDIFCEGAGKGNAEVIILDPKGKKDSSSIKVSPHPVQSDVFRCEYVATMLGLHSVNVFYAGNPIPSSPFGVKVAPISQPNKVWASGRGLQPNGIRVNDIVDFRVHREGAGEGAVGVKIIGPGGKDVLTTAKKLEGLITEYTYSPQTEGRHIVMITFANQEIPRSPFEVNIGPHKNSKIRAFGPGLKGGIINKPAVFCVDTCGETGALGFSIQGPSQAKIVCHDNNDGSADVQYIPTATGEYAIHILCDNDDIPGSPFMAQIMPETDFYPDNVKVFGPGIENGLNPKEKTHFTVDTTEAGKAPLEVKIADAAGEFEPEVRKISEGIFECKYSPRKNTQKQTVMVNYGGVAVPGSPFHVTNKNPIDASKVAVYGPGVETGVRVGIPVDFIVDCNKSGPGCVRVKIESSKRKSIPVAIDDNGDNTYTVSYEAQDPGLQIIKITLDDEEVPQSPIKLDIKRSVDLSKIKVADLDSNPRVDCVNDFTVDISRLPFQDQKSPLGVNITGPDGSPIQANISRPSSVDPFQVSYTPTEEGEHKIDIQYDGLDLPHSPYSVMAEGGCDPSKVKVSGEGLQRGFVDEPNIFVIETKNAGIGELGIAVEGPDEAQINCHDNKDGTCTVNYIPTEEGDYDVNVKFGGEHIPGSPFKVPVDYRNGRGKPDAKKVQAYGPGLEPGQVLPGKPAVFTVDSTATREAPIEVEVYSAGKLTSKKPVISKKGPGLHDVTYIPPPVGNPYDIKVKYGGADISGSPFKMTSNPNLDDVGDDSFHRNGTGLQRKKISDANNRGIKNLIDGAAPGAYGDAARRASLAEIQSRKGSLQNDDSTGRPFDSSRFTDGSSRDDQSNAKKNSLFGRGGRSDTTDNDDLSKPTKKSSLFGGLRDSNKLDDDDGQGRPGRKSSLFDNLRDKIRGNSDESDEDKSERKSSLFGGNKGRNNGKSSVFLGRDDDSWNRKGSKDGISDDEGGISDKIRNALGKNSSSTSNPGRSSGLRDSSNPDGKYSPWNEDKDSFSKGFRPLELDGIPLPSGAKGKIGDRVEASIQTPSGFIAKPKVVDTGNGSIGIIYQPAEAGPHTLDVKYNGENLQGSPFKFYPTRVGENSVSAFGPGLTHGVCGNPVKFFLSTKGVGATGDLGVAVEGPSKAEINIHDRKDGTVVVSFVPSTPGEYKITTKYVGNHIEGSPFSCKVTGEGIKRNAISVGSSSELSLPDILSDFDLRSLQASIVSPSGIEEPCFLKKLPKGNNGISFTPRETGEHLVSVKRNGKHIRNSPFSIMIKEDDVGDGSKVRVSGPGLKEAKTRQDNLFSVDTKNAGYGGLSLSIEGPSKAEIKSKDNEDGILDVAYVPSEPGIYMINLKYADQHIPGSPFLVPVSGEGSEKQTGKIKRMREAVPITEVGSQCRLTFKMPGVDCKDLRGVVSSPDGKLDDALVTEIEEGLYSVNFVPYELGIHTVVVMYREINIPGSPFQFTVGPLQDGGAHLVRAGGQGLERGVQGQVSDFNVWTREAGQGSLVVSVNGPSKADVNFNDRKDGSCHVSYVVDEPGEYSVGIRFNESHIPGSPYKVCILPSADNAERVRISNIAESPVAQDIPQTMLLNMNGAQGDVECKIISPSGYEDDCFITPLGDGEHSVRFLPKEEGAHFLHAKLDGVHIPGSPFKLMVGSNSNSNDDNDPSTLVVSGLGIERGKTGEQSSFMIDTTGVGVGTLTVTMDGPAKVDLSCNEVSNGYEVCYTPSVPGKYFVTVKHNGKSLKGSPFSVYVTGDNLSSGIRGVRSILHSKEEQRSSSMTMETTQRTSYTRHQYSEKRVSVSRSSTRPSLFDKSDASKVSCKGSGLEFASIIRRNTFQVDSTNAGHNCLFVGVLGPEVPCEEVLIKHVGNRIYNVEYVLKEKGNYIIFVKWGDDHVPGSPFHLRA